MQGQDTKQPPVELTPSLWQRLIDVNNSVNVSVEHKTDMEMWGVEERWSYPKKVAAGFQGDTEDYALEKRRLLIESGLSAGHLLMTIAKSNVGDGVAVLTVRTDHGDYILDSDEPRVLLWTDTAYEYLKRQSETNSGVWVTVIDPQSEPVKTTANADATIEKPSNTSPPSTETPDTNALRMKKRCAALLSDPKLADPQVIALCKMLLPSGP